MSTTTGLTRLWQQQRSTMLIGGGLLAAVVIVAVFGTGAESGDPFDPDNPGPDGARAVARVLADDGVEITVARGAAQLAEADVDADADTTVLVVEPDLLGADAVDDLVRRFAGRRLVVAGAGPGVTAALGSTDLPGRVRVGTPRAADCDDPLLGDLEVAVDHAYAYPGDGCFPGRYGALVTQSRGVTLLGADEALTNDQVLRADNAALALRLLGQGDRLVWFVPSLADLQGGDGVSVQTLLPRWIRPGLGVAVLVGLALVLWRGRRLGRLATEPLPVVVRAVETTHSLGRLYRRSGDRPHAATALRRAALRSAAARLQLGRHAEAAEVVPAVARHLGRPEPEIAALLAPDAPAPGSDPALITLATELAELDREVRRP